jgi:hypothetical protein
MNFDVIVSAMAKPIAMEQAPISEQPGCRRWKRWR